MTADADVVIVGAGIAGLTVAHDLARAGRRVIVCEASDHLGGLLRRGRIAGVDIDLGAESFATRTTAVADLVADAGLDLELTSPRPGGAFLATATGHATASAADAAPVPGISRAPLPRRTVLGIPADPRADDVVALIGADAAARAAQEPALPRWRGEADGVEPSLLALVAARCGRPVAERLVDTLCRSVYSRPAAELRLSAVHPGLWRAFCDLGSLVEAAGRIASHGRTGSVVGGIVGGMWRLPDELAAAARARGADLRAGVAVHGVTTGATAGVVVRTSAGSLTAEHVVIATGPAARARLGGGEAVDVPDAGRVRLVAAAIDHPGLGAFPVGSGVIVDPALPTAAKALTHVDAKWAWADAALPAGRHIVRLSAREPDGAGLDTPADIAREVSLLTGVDVRPGDIVDVVVQEWRDALASGPGADHHPARPPAQPRVHVAGAAVAGTGLASVIPHARALAATLLAAPHAAPFPRPVRSLA